MNIDRLQVSNRIQEVMDRVGITQKGLADYLSISQPAVSLYLQGRRIPPAEVLIEIARLGNTNVEWILTGKSQPPQNIYKIEEQTTGYGSEMAIIELWRQLPEMVQGAVLNLLQQFVKQYRK